ncbi:DUF1543 domain-containing protein [Gluconobacter frateurii]|uniref:DUF1543 domain-containing protein n=1 Tax=Gluconobacter frateurii TaxID=38308 RepID=UPI000C077E09|nr:DUF1543 domain-containing protein [Gluconobacter frateurii]
MTFWNQGDTLLKLYVFYLGGNAPGANIEVHDVQFAVAEKPEDAYPSLGERWFGIRNSLHVDAYGEVSWADGYAVTLSTTKPTSDKTLYFINMGGYAPDELKEEHAFTFLVASSEAEAKAKAKTCLLVGYDHQHRDNFMEVDDCLPLQQLDGLYITLTPQENGQPVTALWQGYKRI